MAEVEAIAQRLAELDEDDLTVQLGALAQYVEANPEAAEISSVDEIPVPKGAFDELLKVGKDVFGPKSAGAYKIFCSPVEGVLIKDPALAQELSNLMNQKTAEASAKATAIITPILSGSLGLPQSLAVVVGALLVKQLAKGTSDLICNTWQKNIQETSNDSNEPVPEATSEAVPMSADSPPATASETSSTEASAP
ncbi:MAG: hypothetical protein NW220_00325 [Leptolyngbyaceae cyanobacterium bins.349]|nr:hypothetical protein [Leptolyngbyaceae cyanobacterium bins.349]